MTPEQIQQLRQQYGYSPETLNLSSQSGGDAQSDEINKRLQTVFGGTQEVKKETGNILDVGKGFVKSFVQPVATGANLLSKAEDIIQNKAIDIAAAIKGATPEDIQAYKQEVGINDTQKMKQESAQAIQEKAKIQNDAQQVGKVAGDIAQFVALPTSKGSALARGFTNFASGAALSGVQGGDTTENVIAGGLNAIVPEAGNIYTALKGVKDAKKAQAIIDLVSPRLTPSIAAETKITNPQGILGKISEVTPQRVKEVAEAVSSIVNPKNTFAQNKNLVEKAIETEATNLKNTLSTIKYDGETLKSILKKDVSNIEIPELIKTGDKTVKNQAKAIINKLQAFIDKTITDSADLGQGIEARKLFDKYVQKEFPKAFDDVANARNILIKNARTALNQTLNTLAQNETVSKSLKLQNLMYDALDTISEKVVKGELRKAGEIGSNRITRALNKNPKKTQAAKYAGATIGGAVLGGGAYGALKGLTGN